MKKLLISIILLSTVWGVYYFFTGAPSPLITKTASFVIGRGDTVHQISAQLKKQGFIRSVFAFEGLLWLENGRKAIQAGEYQLSRGWSARRTVATLISAQGRRDVRLTLIEGWTLADYKSYLAEQQFDISDFDVKVNDIVYWQTRNSALSFLTTAKNLEGYVFPDTYLVNSARDLNEVISKALDNFDHKVGAQMREDIEKTHRTMHEVISIASIVEKEVQLSDDRRMVADIFYRRLQQGMALQSDATLNYVLHSGKASLSADDLQLNSPYNTYRNKGLPPTPICNPGLDSIMAAIYPKGNAYLYFLTDKNGTVHYGKTFEEHKRNKELYL